jgi:hypothetical protein
VVGKQLIKHFILHQISSGNLVSICADCHKIRDEQGCWHEIELSAKDLGLVEFTHGLCPDCFSKWQLEVDTFVAAQRP